MGISIYRARKITPDGSPVYGTSISNHNRISIKIIVLCTKLLHLPNFCLISGERGPGFGDTPGGPAELLPWPGSVPYSARPGLMCLSTLDVPVAGGELAHRGTCPTLALYLFKRNKPPRSKYTHTLRGRGGYPVIENFAKTVLLLQKEMVPGLGRILYEGTGMSREYESRVSGQRRSNEG